MANIPTASGGVGPNVRELERVGKQSRRLEVGIAADVKGEKVELKITFYGNRQWVATFVGTPQVRTHNCARSLSAGMLDLARQCAHGVPRPDSVKATLSKGPVRGQQLKRLALAAWYEAFGLPVPSGEGLGQVLRAGRRQQAERRERLLGELRGGPKGVRRWNARPLDEKQRAGHFRRADLSGADLDGADLEHLDFQGAVFDGASLVKANLGRCDLRKARFRNANLREARCGISKLSGADFTRASLRKANLCVCTFSSAVFHETDLRGADFGYSDLRGVDLSGADLRGATFERTTFNEQTRFPPGFAPPAGMDWKGTGLAPGTAPPVAPPAGTLTDFNDFLNRLRAQVDPARLAKALAMLKAERFELFSQFDAGAVVGVVRSQGDASTVYSCRLAADGAFACCTQNLLTCGGLRGRVCKHILVLVVGLAKAGQLDAVAALTWVTASNRHKQLVDKDVMAETFLRYKGAEAGEIDWRPTETLPEDYYAL
jgi:hypothetical protein